MSVSEARWPSHTNDASALLYHAIPAPQRARPLWHTPSLVAEPRHRLIQATPHTTSFMHARRFWRLDDFTDVRWSDGPFPCDLCGQVGRGALRYRWVHRADPDYALWVDRRCALRYFVYPHANTRRSRIAILTRYTQQLQRRHEIAHYAEQCLQDALSPRDQQRWQREVAKHFRLSLPLRPEALTAVWPQLLVWCAIDPPDDDPLSDDEIHRIVTALTTPPVMPTDNRYHQTSW